MVEEPMRNGLEAFLNGEHKIRWHRQTSDQILEDQSLVLQLLPLWNCKRWPHPCPTPTTPTPTASSTTVHLHHTPSSTRSYNTFPSRPRKLKNGPLRQWKAWDRDQPLSQPFGFALSVVCRTLLSLCASVWKFVWVCVGKGGQCLCWGTPRDKVLVSFYWVRHWSLCA